jgi:hypothetical protein
MLNALVSFTLAAVLLALLRQHQMEVRIMASLNTFTELLTAVDAETTRIGAKIQTLIDQLAAGGLSAEEEATVLAGLGAAADKLKGIGVDPADPVPVDPV